MKDIHEILKQYWGYGQFRTLQEDIIRSVLAHNDTLALLPTGGGKSVCFQVPALAMDGVCVVITPLIALMKDQVEQLKKRQIPAVAIYSGMNKREIDIALDNCVYGNIKFLYVSPERLQTEIFRERVKKMKVCLLAIDEAHCISQWGYDFRPSYLEIGTLRQPLDKTPVIALTATATTKVQEDIQEKLLFKNGKVFQKSFARDNLSYSCFYEEDKERKLIEILTNVKGTSIVYVRSRKKAQDLFSFLSRRKISSAYYHAGLNHAERAYRQDSWIKGETRVIVATNAFGMGIDKPDVRTVIHWEIPDSLEAYYQEAGRAGRDEQKSYAVLLFNDNDIAITRERIKESYPAIDFIKKVYQSLANYYKIAVGSGNMTSFDFDRDDFERIYNLPRLETFYALKRLESEGFIQVNELQYSSSKIYVRLDHKALYEFQIAYQRYDPLIKAISRMYGGEMFTNFIPVSEKDIARNLSVPIAEVTASLHALEKLDVLEYDKQKDRPQLVFTIPRQDASKLPLDVKKIEERKKNDLEKSEAVIHYAQQTARCRTLVLLDYFGEISDRNCGVCDVCIRGKREGSQSENFIRHRLKIIEAVVKSPLTLEMLVSYLGPGNKEEALEVIRQMLDAGELFYDQEDKINFKS